MTTATLLPHLEIANNPDQIQASLIFLHGLGADGNDFLPLAHDPRLSKLGLRFIFPHAPIQPVTINGGYRMRAWYDILALSKNALLDEVGIAKSVAEIRKFITREIARGIPSQNIILGGFSQGALLALATGLSWEQELAGVIALSGYLPHAKRLLQDRQAQALAPLNIFLAHGRFDEVVPYQASQELAQLLQQHSYPVVFKSFSMQHEVCPEELSELTAWCAQRLS